jgi:hypothetical protein
MQTAGGFSSSSDTCMDAMASSSHGSTGFAPPLHTISSSLEAAASAREQLPPAAASYPQAQPASSTQPWVPRRTIGLTMAVMSYVMTSSPASGVTSSWLTPPPGPTLSYLLLSSFLLTGVCQQRRVLLPVMDLWAGHTSWRYSWRKY